jgi:uncharacterized protein (TIRG00374 family)
LGLISRANLGLFVLAIAFEICALIGYANLFRYLLFVLDIRLRLGEVMRITLAGLSVSHVFSAGGAGGWVVSYNALRRKNVPHGLVFVAIAAQNFFNYVVLWSVFFVAMIYLVVLGDRAPWAYAAATIVILALLWLTAYGVYLYNHRIKMRRRVATVARIVNKVMRREVIHQDHIDGWLDNLFAGMRRMTSHHNAFRTTFAYACFFWSFDLLCLYVTFLAFHYNISFESLAIGYVVAYSVGTLAPTPSGLGAIEGLMIAMFAGFGVPPATAVAAVLTYRLINFWLPIPPGLIAYVTLR